MAEGLARDLLLLNFNQQENIQHSAIKPALEKGLLFLNKSADDNGILILQQLKLIAQAKEYLVANVNPRLVLEQVAINL